MRTTDINDLSVPELGDSPPDIEEAFAFADQIDTKLNSVFETPAARNAAIVTPTAGMKSFCESTEEEYIYRGGIWVSSSPRTKVKSSDTLRTNTVAVDVDAANDPHFLWAVEPSSVYVGELTLWVSSTGADADIRLRMNGPEDTEWRVGYGSIGPDATDADTSGGALFPGGVGADFSDDLRLAALATNSPTIAFYNFTAFTPAFVGSANIVLRWAQFTQNAEFINIWKGSSGKVWKVG